MISLRVEDEEFQSWLTSLEYRIFIMKDTLMNIAHTIEMQGRKFVPVDTTRLEQTLQFSVMP